MFTRKGKVCVMLTCVSSITLLISLYIGWPMRRNKVQYADTTGYSRQTMATLQKIANLEFKNSSSLMQSLGLNKTPSTVTTSLPVFVTGADSAYYMTSQGLIKSIYEVLVPKYPDLKLIYYDLGLTEQQAKQLRKHCKCEVRTFPFSTLPQHVRKLKCYAFKPIAIQMVFQEFGNLYWLDSAIRFLSDDLDAEFKRLKDNNILFYTADQNNFTLPLRTRLEMFVYFKEDPWKYMSFYEIQGGNVAFKDCQMTRVLLRQWVACALDKECIDPPGAKLYCIPLPKVMTSDLIGACHRYDQSALNIMLRMLFYERNEYRLPVYLEFRGGQAVNYFPND